LAALQRLETLRQSTGRQFSLLGAVTEFAEVVEKLPGRALGAAINRYLCTEVLIQRKDIMAAVEEFIEGRKHKSESQNGKGSQMSGDYAYNVAMWLRPSIAVHPFLGIPRR
jgi:hypothetical protein